MRISLRRPANAWNAQYVRWLQLAEERQICPAPGLQQPLYLINGLKVPLVQTSITYGNRFAALASTGHPWAIAVKTMEPFPTRCVGGLERKPMWAHASEIDEGMKRSSERRISGLSGVLSPGSRSSGVIAGVAWPRRGGTEIPPASKK
jgi:hypothetical protein